jgi:immune inhibitor A
VDKKTAIDTKRHRSLMNLSIRLWLLLGLLYLAACTAVYAPDPQPAPFHGAPPLDAATLFAALDDVEPEPADRLQFARQMGLPFTPLPSTPPVASMGDTRQFWVADLGGDSRRQISAALLHATPQVAIWVENGVRIRAQNLETTVTRIEDEIFAPLQTLFDRSDLTHTQLHILHLRKLDSIATAYFLETDRLPQSLQPFSNELDLLYINLERVKFGSSAYRNAVAHEYQHWLQQQVDPNESSWLNEGLADLAADLSGFPPERAADYANNTDLPLLDFSQDPTVTRGHYAHSYLFTRYFMDRFGLTAVQELIARPENGRHAITAQLANNIPAMTFIDLFADWLVANALNSLNRETTPYQYRNVTLPDLSWQRPQRFPSTLHGQVHQFGADYLLVEHDTALTLSFTGTLSIPAAPTLPASGDHFYGTLPADGSEHHLTRAVDLRAVDAATFTFSTWYDIEAGWDYAYLLASTDNGNSWDPLPFGPQPVDNPHGNSLGPSVTGLSGGGETAVWQPQQIDLSAFAGQEILLRFTLLTDGAIHQPGLFLDDFAIPEIGFFDDAEQAGIWEESGFYRLPATWPQPFLVQQILLSPAEVTVSRLQIDNSGGEFILPLDKQTNRAILIISAAAPLTSEPAAYELHLEQ